MATLRMAADSVFSTIGETAQAASAIVNTAASGVHMINDFVSAARIKQQTSIKISLATHQSHAIEDQARLNTERDQSTKEWLGNDADKAQAYLKHHSELSALFT